VRSWCRLATAVRHGGSGRVGSAYQATSLHADTSLLRTTQRFLTLPCLATMVRTRAVQGSEPSSCLTHNPRAATNLREAEPHSARYDANCLRVMGRNLGKCEVASLKFEVLLTLHTLHFPLPIQTAHRRRLFELEGGPYSKALRAESHRPSGGRASLRSLEAQRGCFTSFAFLIQSSSACARFPRTLLSGHVRASRRSSARCEPTGPHAAKR